MKYVLLDILIGNYSNYTSFFFLNNLNNKSYIYNIAVAIFLDFIVLKTYYINIVLISLFYIIRKYIFKQNLNNYYKYIIVNLFFTMLYYLITAGFFNYIKLSKFLIIIIIHFVFYSICYIKEFKYI